MTALRALLGMDDNFLLREILILWSELRLELRAVKERERFAQELMEMKLKAGGSATPGLEVGLTGFMPSAAGQASASSQQSPQVEGALQPATVETAARPTEKMRAVGGQRWKPTPRWA